MVHLAEQVAPGIDVVFLDTGYHFVETIGTRDAVEAVHDVNVITLTPTQTVAEQDADLGQGPVRPRPRPVLRAAQGRSRSSEALAALRRLGDRAAPRRVARPGPTRRSSPGTRSGKMIKVAPIATWTDDDVADYIEQQRPDDQPAARGRLPSIGCEPCTCKVDGQDARAGRWAGLAKTECGIHL